MQCGAVPCEHKHTGGHRYAFAEAGPHTLSHMAAAHTTRVRVSTRHGTGPRVHRHVVPAGNVETSALVQLDELRPHLEKGR